MRIGCGRASECRRMGEVLGAAVGAEPRRVRSHRRASGVRCPATSERAVCVAWAIVPRCARAGCDTQPSAREREGAAGARAGCCGWVAQSSAQVRGREAERGGRRGNCGVSQCARAACCAIVGAGCSPRSGRRRSILSQCARAGFGAQNPARAWDGATGTRARCGMLPLLQRRGTMQGHCAGPECGGRTLVWGQGEVSGWRAWPTASAARATRPLAREPLRVTTDNAGAESRARPLVRGKASADTISRAAGCSFSGGYLIWRKSASVRQSRAARRSRLVAGRS